MDNLPVSVAKLVKSLQIKKYRSREKSFLVQGTKSFLELLNSDYELLFVVGTAEFYQKHSNEFSVTFPFYQTTESRLAALGTFDSNQSVVAVVRQKENIKPLFASDTWILALDDIRDPGNLGTIIRTADWFAIENIIASPSTADFYNPKTISASMGSFTRVKVFYSDLYDFFSGYSGKIYLSDLEGINIRDKISFEPGAIVLGNESTGVRSYWKGLPHTRINIPGSSRVNSLNVAVSCGIILDRLKG